MIATNTTGKSQTSRNQDLGIFIPNDLISGKISFGAIYDEIHLKKSIVFGMFWVSHTIHGTGIHEWLIFGIHVGNTIHGLYGFDSTQVLQAGGHILIEHSYAHSIDVEGGVFFFFFFFGVRCVK